MLQSSSNYFNSFYCILLSSILGIYFIYIISFNLYNHVRTLKFRKLSKLSQLDNPGFESNSARFQIRLS